MMFDIVQFIGSGNEYLISCDNSRSEIFRLLDGLPSQTAAMDEHIIECALLSGGARVIGQAKITIEISLT